MIMTALMLTKGLKWTYGMLGKSEPGTPPHDNWQFLCLKILLYCGYKS